MTKQAAGDARYLLALYVAERRRLQPTYDPMGPRPLEDMLRLRGALLDLNVPRESWCAYVQFSFDEISRRTAGRVAFPPTPNVAARGEVDRYVCSLVARKLDAPKAKRMLRAAGFSDVNLSKVLSIVDSAARAGVAPGDLDPSATTRERLAVEWLAPRLRAVGYLASKLREAAPAKAWRPRAAST